MKYSHSKNKKNPKVSYSCLFIKYNDLQRTGKYFYKDFGWFEMSGVVRFCRKCGSSIVPGARFCNRCGTTVDPQSTFPAPTESSSLSKTANNEISPLESVSQVEESLEEEIPPDEFKRLVTTYNVWRLEEQLNPLEMKLEELSAKKDIGELAEEEYNSESEGLKEEKQHLEKELNEKMDVKPLSVYFLKSQEQEAAERLNKLENIFEENKISQTTYSKLKKEYSEKLQAIRHELTYEHQKMSKWKRILEKEVNNAKIALEELLVRYEIGEVSEDEYLTKKSDLEAKRKDLENSLTLINHLLK